MMSRASLQAEAWALKRQQAEFEEVDRIVTRLGLTKQLIRWNTRHHNNVEPEHR